MLKANQSVIPQLTSKANQAYDKAVGLKAAMKTHKADMENSRIVSAIRTTTSC